MIQSNHAEFLVVLIPLREQICCQHEINKFEGFQITKPNEVLHNMLERAEIQSLDLLPYFLEEYHRIVSKKLYYDNDPHWTAAGHQLAARIIAGQIE